MAPWRFRSGSGSSAPDGSPPTTSSSSASSVTTWSPRATSTSSARRSSHRTAPARTRTGRSCSRGRARCRLGGDAAALHRAPAVAAMERGLPVFLEKPIARTLDDARAIAETAERNRCRLRDRLSVARDRGARVAPRGARRRSRSPTSGASAPAPRRPDPGSSTARAAAATCSSAAATSSTCSAPSLATSPPSGRSVGCPPRPERGGRAGDIEDCGHDDAALRERRRRHGAARVDAQGQPGATRSTSWRRPRPADRARPGVHAHGQVGDGA